MNTNEKLTEERASGVGAKARQRIALLLDEGSFEELGRTYGADGRRAEVVTGYGTVYGMPVYVFSQDPDSDGGAMSVAQAFKISQIYDLADKTGSPVVGIFDSKGARVDEGVKVLSALSELLLKSNGLSGVVPQIAVIDGVCASSSAMLACVSDLVVMTEGSELFLTPPFNSTKGNTGSAAQALENGTAQVVCADEKEAFETVKKLLTMLPDNNLSPVLSQEPAASAGGCPYCDLVDEGSDVVISPAFGSKIKASLARINGTACGIVACKKCDKTKIDRDSAIKASRFVRFCDAFSIPVVTIVDADGFEEDDGGELRSSAALSHAYSEATTAKICVISGRAVGAACVALCGKAANADKVMAYGDAVISAVDPEAAAIIMYADRLSAGESREALTAEYTANEASAFTAAEYGVVDEVILPEEVKNKVSAALSMLSSKRVETAAKKHSNMPL